MIQVVFLLILATLFASSASAQDTCPTVTVRGPAGVPRPGDLITFTANVDIKSSTYKPIFRWTISTGEIISGQGTASLIVRPPTSGLSLTVTVELLGLSEGCTAAASETMSGPHPPSLAIQVGEMRGIEPINAVSIAEFAAELMENPNNQGFVFAGHPAGTSLEKIQQREKSLRDAILSEDFNHFDGSRITIVTIPDAADIAEFWRVPPGADNPKCRSCESIVRLDCGLPFDDYGRISKNEEMMRLDSTAIAMTHSPAWIGVVILFVNPAESKMGAERRHALIRNHLTKTRKIPSERLDIRFAQGEETRTSVYLMTPELRSAPVTAFDATSTFELLKRKK